jgi:hypothetical protein
VPLLSHKQITHLLRIAFMGLRARSRGTRGHPQFRPARTAVA